jgi:demethylmenaquinone methyltransferase/2-methoxy-6-polyprenyl-1,4-benzoquinol methylase
MLAAMSSTTTSTRAPDEPVSFGARYVPRAEKGRLVRGVFDSVASRYDLMNDAMSLGVHRVWKAMTIARANPQPGERLIDVAGGTGDLARLWLKTAAAASRRRGGPSATAVVCDINEAMVRAGRARGRVGLGWVTGDAERLPFPDRTADAVTIGFGIRNVTDRAAALAEMRRVLKPGGRFLCLEFSKPTTAALAAAYGLWSKAIPSIGAAVAQDRASYDYLVESIRRFPDQATFLRELETAGFARATVTNYSGGIVALHMGWRI